MRKYLYLVLIVLFNTSLFSQILPSKTIIESGFSLSTGAKSPFWLVSNKYGLLSSNNMNSYLRGFIEKEISNSKKIDYAYGIDILNRYDTKNRLLLHQAYLQTKYEFLKLTAGKKEEFIGNQDTTLSSGGAIWSGNAPPLPKITLATNSFVALPFTNGYAEVDLGYSHGWFGNDGYVKGVYLHQKYFYIKLGGSGNFHFTAGLQHYVQWGGTSPNPDIGILPNDFKDYLKAVFAYNNDGVLDTLTANMPKNESKNRIGNHVGTKDFGIDFILKDTWKVKLYWQNFIEDITGMGFRNATDGIWGVEIKNKRFGFLYEFIHTYTKYYPVDELSETLDNYFNNGIYQQGWTYNGYVIGTPFITSPILLNDTIITNNRVKVHYLAIQYNSKRFKSCIRYSRSENYGNPGFYITPPLVQNSLICEFTKPEFCIANLELTLNLATDIGNLFKKNIGALISVKYYL